MGLDFVIYKNTKKAYMLTMSESLHSIIFDKRFLWRSFAQLRKMEDYYVGQVVYTDKNIKNLISDLEQYQIHIPKSYIGEYRRLTDMLKHPQATKIVVAGD